MLPTGFVDRARIDSWAYGCASGVRGHVFMGELQAARSRLGAAAFLAVHPDDLGCPRGVCDKTRTNERKSAAAKGGQSEHTGGFEGCVSYARRSWGATLWLSQARRWPLRRALDDLHYSTIPQRQCSRASWPFHNSARVFCRERLLFPFCCTGTSCFRHHITSSPLEPSRAKGDLPRLLGAPFWAAPALLPTAFKARVATSTVERNPFPVASQK
jgi:hypothetical protein